MDFLADESCDALVVRALRTGGHDVASVAEASAGLSDREVLAWARREQRVVVTEDRDFGQLVFAGSAEAHGVLLIRFPSSARSTVADSVLTVVAEHAASMHRSFIVIEPGRTRATRLP